VAKQPLTELEGMILSEIRRHQGCTAYEIRETFAASRSVEWGNSKGAVYPAIRRLHARGLVVAESVTGDARGTRRLRLTSAGRKSLGAWSADIDRAVGPGTDPFRSRALQWSAMAPDAWAVLRATLLAEIESVIDELEGRLETLELSDRWRVELDLGLQRSRRDWLLAN